MIFMVPWDSGFARCVVHGKIGMRVGRVMLKSLEFYEQYRNNELGVVFASYAMVILVLVVGGQKCEASSGLVSGLPV